MPGGTPLDRAEDAVEKPEVPVSQRATELRRERRRREPGDIDVMARQKLAIPPEIQAKLKAEGLTPRWALDQGGRVQQLQAEEWDIVPGVGPVSASRTSGEQHVLMAKREDWYEEDREHLRVLNRKTERQAEAGQIGDGEVDAKGFYAPKTKNRISRGA